MKQYVIVLVLFVLFATIGAPSAHAGWVPNGLPVAPSYDPVPGPPQIISDGSGGAIITWQDSRGTSGKDIYAQRVDASGAVLWAADGIVICAATNHQQLPQIVSDGSGGAIITWYDYRGGTYSDIYAQRVNAGGVVQWITNGIAICTAEYSQETPQLLSDDSGGAIIAWKDARDGSYSDIYAQRVDASGAALWTANGVAVCQGANDQGSVQLISDGSGGAIITWEDARGGSTKDIYAQRVNASGAVQWTTDGIVVSSALNNQDTPLIVSDGSGGAIVTWQDFRGGTYYDIYAQRVDASGAAQWTADGIAVCAAANNQYYPRISSDGSGGAIITWQDYRGGSYYDIYAQRVNVSGAVQWTADGVALCTATNTQAYPRIASDGSSGAIVTWQDYRGGSYYDIYAQRVDASGAVQWTADGAAICTAQYTQVYPAIAAEASGGVIVAWEDHRAGGYGETYAQRTGASGSAQWTADGVSICTASNNQAYPQIVSDGSGGAIVAWHDQRSGSNYDIYVQRTDATGDIRWTMDGVAICTAGYDQLNPQIVSDGSGGAIVTWQDYRSGSGNDIYAQRVNADGIVQWTVDGIAVCAAALDQTKPQIFSDGSEGAIVAWQDYRAGNNDIYAQRVNADGIVQWAADGIAICAAAYTQANPQLASDGSGGAIITWQDYRASNYDIYAQRVNADGIVQWMANGVAMYAAAYTQANPQIVSDGSGGAIITWEDYRGGSHFDIYAQRVNGSGDIQWTSSGIALCTVIYDQLLPQIVSDGLGGAIVVWQDYRDGSYYDIYAQRVDASGVVYWQAGGAAICTAANSQVNPHVASDDAGGAIITWRDYRNVSDYNIYAQWVDASGTLRWTTGALAICTAALLQTNPQITSDGLGGAIITWQDSRTGISTRIYAQRTTEFGLGPICDVDPLEIHFAEAVSVGGWRDTLFTITNAGIESFVGSVSEASDQFEIISGGGSFFLANGESRLIVVRYEPTAPGIHICTVETGVFLCGDVSIAGTAVRLPPDSVIFVDADAAGAGGGSSWTDAFTELSDALAYAPSCPLVTQIWVAEGTYRPTADGNRAASFHLLSGLAIYGGFAGTETARSERDVSAHVTTLNGDIGTPGDASDNSCHVVTGSGTDSTAVLDGFTVTGGMADGGVSDQQMGAGFYSLEGSPTIANVEFRDNEAQVSGGGIWIANSNSRITNAVLRDNRSAYGGGIFSGGDPSPMLANVLFIGNEASQSGGGIFSSCPLYLVNASFFGNSAVSGGGGIYNSQAGMVIANVIMWGDSSVCFSGHENCAEICNIGTLTVSHSLVQGSGGSAGWDAELGTDGGGNIDADPLYYGAKTGDLRILVGSPAIDAGDSSVSGLAATDIAGDIRIQGATVDMGAYEGGTVALLHSYARVDSLVDVPNDQGGWLRIYFARSSYDDVLEEEYPIAQYDIHRRVDEPGLLASINNDGEVIRENLVVKLPGGEKVSLAARSAGAGSMYVRCADRYYLVNEAGAAGAAPPGTWEVVGNVSARQQAQYIQLAPTLADSAETLTWSVFYISAHTTTPSVYFDSPPDSGYSVDNIAPGVPKGFAVAYGTGSGNHLSWDPCGDDDFQYFKVYRSTDRYFDPAPGNLVEMTIETEWTDPEYDTEDVYYEITALDYAGNESAPAILESTTGAGDQATPRSFALHQNAPNPFNPETMIRYDVPPMGGRVIVTIYDVSGRLVRTLVDGARTAGQHSARWDGRNESGQRLASGVYFCRMTARGFVGKQKMILLR